MENTDEIRKALISLGLSHMLDCMGYSPQMMNLRGRMHRNMDYLNRHFSYQNNLPSLVKIVGSKAEGGSRLFESDIDALYMIKYVVCVEASVLKHTESLSYLNSVYTMVPCVYHPGHFKLLLTRKGLITINVMRTCLNPSDSRHWLSSKGSLELFKHASKIHTTSGPAVCSKNIPNQADRDITITFPCFCPSILGNWIQRDRKYNWPPSEVIQQISQMSGNLVATGIKGCYEEEIEWRLCFNEIELLLVENWNETERKLYTFLKMIKRDVLKLGHEITSYMMKNIVFWLSGRYPQTDLRSSSLFSWAMKALQLLKQAVKKFYLPYYMIPERNLIAEKLPKYRRKIVIKQINNAIKLGPQLFWKCKKIEMAMTMSLPELQLYQQKINELEWLVLLHVQDRGLKCEVLGLTESDWEKTDYIIAIDMRMNELVFSPWPPVVQHQLSYCSTYGDKIELLLK